MLNKMLQNKKIAVVVLIVIIISIAGVFLIAGLQEHQKSDVNIDKGNNLKEEVEKQNEESQNMGLESPKDESKTQTETVDHPISREDNDGNGMTDKPGTTDQKDSSSSLANQDTQSQNTGMEILEDDSKTQTESVDAPISWDENYENSMTNKTDATNKTDTSNKTDKIDSSSSSTDKDKETNMPIEKSPDDEDVEYGSIF